MQIVWREEWPAIVKDHFDRLAVSKTEDEELDKNMADFEKIRQYLALQLYQMIILIWRKK